MSRAAPGEVPNRAGGGGSTAPAALAAALLTMRMSHAFFWDDCEYPVNVNSTPYLLVTGGAGTVCAAYSGSDMKDNPGQSEYGTGTTSTGRIGDRTHTAAFQLSGGEVVLARRMRFPVLSSAAQRYGAVVGFISVGTAIDQTNAVLFEYDEGGVATGGSASPNWKCVTADNAARTRTTTSVAVTDATFQTLMIIINAAGTQAGFYINGALVASHTTNIPTAAARRVGAGWQIIKSVGTTAVSPVVDFYGHDVACAARAA